MVLDFFKFDPGEIFELKARLTSSITMLETFISSITERQTQKSPARLEKRGEEKMDEQKQEGVFEWISKDCDRHTDRLNWLVGRHEPGTRKWLFESAEWQTWTGEQGRGTTLFCPGISGAGKTYTSASKQFLNILAFPDRFAAMKLVPHPMLMG